MPFAIANVSSRSPCDTLPNPEVDNSTTNKEVWIIYHQHGYAIKNRHHTGS